MNYSKVHTGSIQHGMGGGGVGEGEGEEEERKSIGGCSYQGEGVCL